MKISDAVGAPLHDAATHGRAISTPMSGPNALSSFALDDRVAIVTGATGLLGREHARALASVGACVAIVDLDARTCDAWAEVLASETGARTLGVAADITRPNEVQSMHEIIRRQFGEVDVLVNNAAIDDKFDPDQAIQFARFERYPLAAWQRALDVNVTGAFLCCQTIGSAMALRGTGSIINVASTYGVVAPNQSLYRHEDGSQSFFKSAAYPTTKSALLGLTRFLASYWGDRHVRVNALSPGGVENGQEPSFVARYAERTPLGRMAHPADYRGALLFLASDASAYMTGANLMVDGGFTVW
jgi:NAD(P)-dependent dehydrogenase (short-subunit alcohol dehydrogenase family)